MTQLAKEQAQSNELKRLMDFTDTLPKACRDFINEYGMTVFLRWYNLKPPKPPLSTLVVALEKKRKETEDGKLA